MSSTCGLCSRALAISTRRRRPPERVSTRSLRRSIEAEALHGALHAVAQGAAAESVEVALGAQVLFDRECLIEALRLEDDADVTAHRRGVALHVVAGDDGVAIGRHHHGREDAEEGRLAAAVGTEQAEDFALLHFEADVRKRDAVAVTVGKVLDLNHRPGLSMSISP